MRRNKRLLISLLSAAVILPAAVCTSRGAGLNLLEEGSLDVFEVRDSTAGSISDEFNRYIDRTEPMKFDKKLWEDIKKEKEKGEYEVMPEVYAPATISGSTYTLMGEELPQAEIELPYQTRLSITGRKSISVKYGNVYYMGDEDDRTIKGTPVDVTKGFEMEQELRVRIKGKVGEKITVNVDYDDTKPSYDEDARRISVLYNGDKEEIIQEAAFGDITLSLPSTHFVGYSKNVFGAKVRGRYKKFSFMAIGSQTKGKTEIKEFTGQATFTKKDINDTSYTRRTYYNIDLGVGTSHLPIDPGSVKVYLDDKDGSNNDSTNASYMAVTYYGSTQTYSGYFYQLVAGRDYTVDTVKGILNFNTYIKSNYVIAVEYKYNDGKGKVGYSSGDPVMIKDENETLAYEFKNRYNLGSTKILRDDFVLKFLDLNRNKVELPYGSYDIDYDLGLLEFTKDTPFYKKSKAEGYDKGGFADIYNNTNPQHHYIIYVEYKKRIKSYLLRPNIIKGSERVLMDEKVLERDVDYVIDYPSGFLTFLNPEKIDETTGIEVTYEYMPFGGLFKETLIGMRGEYNFSENLFVGGTMLYNWASAPMELPQIHSTPESTLVLDSDFKLNIEPVRYFPLPTTVSGEVAQSIYNPNTLGKAIIDNMEGIRQPYSLPMNPDSWFIARTPSGVPQKPSWLTLREEDEYLSDINPNVSTSDDEKKKVMYLDYDLPADSADSEVSIVFPMSDSGIDLTMKDTVQMWIFGDGRGTEIQLDFGSISEDADSTGEIKTEDKNNNNTLDKGEDKGWKYIYEGSTYTVGDDNSRIDTNDLDGDGQLDVFEDYQVFDVYREDLLRVDWRGWKRIVIPRGGTDAKWSAVKHARITLRNNNTSGSIGFASIEAVGNKWEIATGTSTLFVDAVNNYDNEDYETPIDMDIYQDIYSEVGGSDLDKEQAMELRYEDLADGTTVYVYSKYPQAVDFSQHKKISFLLYGDGEGVDFFISFGAGNNYFIRKVKTDFRGWRKFTYKLSEDFEEVGAPKLTNIAEVRLGLINNTGTERSGKVWVNEIYLEEPEKRIGHAWRGSFESSVPGYLNFGGTYQTMDKDFQTITTPPKNQNNTTYSANARLTAISYLPIYGNYTESIIETPPERIKPTELNPYLTEDDSGEVVKKSGSVGADFTKRYFPKLTGGFAKSEETSNFTGKTEVSETRKGSGSYGIPLRLFFLPETIRGSYRKTDTDISWKEYKREQNPLGGFEESLEETIEYSYGADMDLFKLLMLQPSYLKNEKYKTWDYYFGPYANLEDPVRWKWSQSQDVGLDTRLSLLKWFRPNAKATVKTDESYNYIKDGSLSLYGGTKDVSRNFNLKAGAGLPVTKLLPFFSPVDNLRLNSNIELEKGETYNDMDADYDVFSNLDPMVLLSTTTTETSRLVTLTNRTSQKYTADWTPLKFLRLNKGVLNLMGGMDVRGVYTNIFQRKETTGTVLKTLTEIWPDLDVSLGKLDRLPFSRNYMTDIAPKGNYSFKDERTFSNGEGISLNTRIRYGGSCRFMLFSGFDTLLDYDKQETELIDLQNEEKDWETRAFSETYGAQVKIKLKQYSNLITRYTYRKDEKLQFPDNLLTDIERHSPSIRYDAIINLPSKFKLPIFGKEISLLNRLKIIAEIRGEFSRSDLDIEKTNSDKYMSDIATEMDISSNIRWTIGFGAQYMEYLYGKYRKANSYFAFHLKTELVIRF
ncbi:MAG: hypothetical protein JXJ19_07825 [Elusimicrobia bacterium]|nr:hypothetical protein [Elusimicrobiota bacterium]